jgi:hypothetical protein
MRHEDGCEVFATAYAEQEAAMAAERAHQYREEVPRCATPRPDNWKYRSSGVLCHTCMYFVEKPRINEAHRPDVSTGRCRRHSPTLSGWPVMKPSDWCGDHKLDEEKV